MGLDNCRVVVIGGAGLIGSHVVDQLAQEPVREIVIFDDFSRGRRSHLARALKDYRVSVVEGSILDQDLLRDVMQSADFAFHAAGLGSQRSVQEPRETLRIHIEGTYNVLEAAHQAGVKKVVYASSALVYGPPGPVPMAEEHPLHNRTLYGTTKIAAEHLLRAFRDRHGLAYAALRYSNVYGPRMGRDDAGSSLISGILERVAHGLPPLVAGDGSQTLDLVHAVDAARAGMLALVSGHSDEVFNIASGMDTTVGDLVHKLLSITGSFLQPERRAQLKGLPVAHGLSVEKAARLLGFKAGTSLSEGLRSVYNWRLNEERAAAGACA